MIKFTKVIFGLLFIIYAFDSSSYANDGIVTSIQDEFCSKIKEEEYTGATEFRCLGVGGYNLLTLYDDNRMSLDVISPGNEKYPLELWSKVTTSFSVLGNDVEWRVSDRKESSTPIALIAKVSTASEELNTKSWWVIVKISPKAVCITNILESNYIDIGAVRILADSSLSQSCSTQ